MRETWIRSKRKNLGVSQYKMARVLGVTFQQLSSWEMGKEEPNDSEKQRVEKFFSEFHRLVANGVVKLKKQRVVHSYELSDKATAPKLQPKHAKSAAAPAFLKKKLPKNAPTAITLFSGIGGMSLGFLNAGYKIAGFVELEESAREIYGANFPNTECLGSDVRGVSNEQVLGWKKKFGEVDVLAGGPPCQGFSLAGKRNILDPRNELYNEFARIAGVLQPKCILLENVRTFLTMQTSTGEFVKDDLIRKFDAAGYRLTYASVNAMNFGVPQSRERVLFIGLRKDLAKTRKLGIPAHSHFEKSQTPGLPGIGGRSVVTFKDAVSDLEALESGEISSHDPWHFAVRHPDHVVRMLAGVPEGKSAHENPDPKMRPTSGYNTTYKRLVWNAPAATVSTNFSMISGSRNVHPRDTRAITIREAMRCQTFPDDFVLKGTLGDIRRGIGNAVPPLLAKQFAEHIKETLL